jgi:hypothetical protein
MNENGERSIYTALGEIGATLKSLDGGITEVKCDVKELLKFQSATEERLKNGMRRFESQDARIAAVECRKFPTARIVAIISLGFMVLGILMRMG